MAGAAMRELPLPRQLSRRWDEVSQVSHRALIAATCPTVQHTTSCDPASSRTSPSARSAVEMPNTQEVCFGNTHQHFVILEWGWDRTRMETLGASASAHAHL